MTTANGTAKFGGRQVLNYRRPYGRWFFHPALREGRFTRWDVPAMLQDSAIHLGLYTIFGPLWGAKWEVRANSREVKTFIENTLYRFWHHDLFKVLYHYVSEGTAVGEVLYEREPGTGLWRYAGLDDFDMNDVQALRKGRNLVGARVSYGSTAIPGAYVPPSSALSNDRDSRHWNELRHPKLFWCGHAATCGELWGKSTFEAAWNPWAEKVFAHGAISIRKLWAFSNAYRGCLVKYPPGNTRVNGVLVDNRDIAQELAETYATGGAFFVPSDRDDNGNPLWEIVDPQMNGEIKGLLEYPTQLDKEIWQGMGVLDEVIHAPDTGGSWSGRSGPLLIFLNISDMRVREILTAFDVGPSGYTTRNEQAGGPIRSLVLENFGPKARYEIRPYSLVPKPMGPDGAGMPGESGPGNGPGAKPKGPKPGSPLGSAPLPNTPPVKLSAADDGVELPNDLVNSILGVGPSTQLSAGHDVSGEARDESGKWTHGAHANKLAEKHKEILARHAQLKKDLEQHREARRAAFDDIRERADKASEQADEHVENARKAIDNIAWDASDEAQEPFSDLETAIYDYDPASSPAERFEQLKAIESAAQAASAVDQPLESEESSQRTAKAKELRTRAADLDKQRGEIHDQYDALTAKGDQAAVDAFVNEHTVKLGALKADADDARREAEKLEAETDEGISAQDKAANKQHLAVILQRAHAAKEQLRQYVKHRKELRAIKSGESISLSAAVVISPEPDGSDEWSLSLSAFDPSDHPRGQPQNKGEFASKGTAGSVRPGYTIPLYPKRAERKAIAKADEASKGLLAKGKAALDKVPGAKAMREKAAQVHAALEKRYGAKQAMLIVGAAQAVAWGALAQGAVTGVPLWLPGSTVWGVIPFAAMAEVWYQMKKRTRKKEAVALSGAEGELSLEEIEDLGARLARHLAAWWRKHGGKPIPDEEIQTVVDDSMQLSAARAPHGYTHQRPLVIQGQSYVGGQYIPGHVMDKATPQEKAAVHGGAPAQTGMGRQHEQARAQEAKERASTPPKPAPKPAEREPEKTGALYGHNSFPKAPEGEEKYGGKIDRMPGLSPQDRQTEAAAAQKALEHFPELRQDYLKAGNGDFDAEGRLKSVVFNTDEWRDLFAGEGYKGTNASAVHEPSSYANKKLLAEFLPVDPKKPETAQLHSPLKGVGNQRLAIYAGGGGSGKGTAVKEYFDEAQYPLRVDQVTDNFKKAADLFDRAKANGFAPEYIFVDRKPEDAWKGVVGRAIHLRKNGKPARTVPIDIALKANIEARRTAIELLEKRPDIPANIIDNVGGEGKRRLIVDRAQAIHYLKGRLKDDEARMEAFRKAAKDDIVRRVDAGEIPEDIAHGLMGDQKKFEEHRNVLSRSPAVPADHAAGTQSPAAENDRRGQPGRSAQDAGRGPPDGRGAEAHLAGTPGQGQSALDENAYVQQAMGNLKKTSRTAAGTVDTSASAGKAANIAEGLTGDKAAQHAAANFEGVVKNLYQKRKEQFTPQSASSLADDVNKSINKGITKPGVLMRTDDSAKYPYTSAADLPAAHKQFGEELAQRLNNPKADPVETAAWIEWRVNMTDHFYADGCGKASKALAAMPLMRAGLPLPNYPDNKEFFKYSQKQAYDPKKGGQTYLDDNWKRFLGFYRSLMPQR